MKIMLVNDCLLIRKGLSLVLQSFPEIDITAEAEDGLDGISKIHHNTPDIILMDLTLPDGIDIFQTAQQLYKEKPEVKIVLLTAHEEEHYIRKAMKIQLNGYLLKKCSPEELFAALKMVHAGKIIFQTRLPVETGKAQKGSAGHLLTLREQEVVRMTVLGYSNLEIGEMLSISVKTVENHKTKIMNKLNMTSRHELVKYGLINYCSELLNGGYTAQQ